MIKVTHKLNFPKNKSLSNMITNPPKIQFPKSESDVVEDPIKIRNFSRKDQNYLNEKFMFYKNGFIKEHQYQQVKASQFLKNHKIVDSPEVTFKIADIIQSKSRKNFKIGDFNIDNQVKQLKSHKTIQTKFRQQMGQRKKFYTLIEDFKNSINQLQGNNKLSLTQIFEYKQHIFSSYLYSLIGQIQIECQQKAKLLETIWLSNVKLMNLIFKMLTKDFTQKQSSNIQQQCFMHNQYQKHLKQALEQNKIFKKQIKEKDQFIQNLIFNLRYRRKEVKHLNASIKIANKKINQYKDIYIELENRYIELQMEVKDLSKQVSSFILHRKRLLQQQRKKKIHISNNKQKMKKKIFDQLIFQNQTELVHVNYLNQILSQNYKTQKQEKGQKFLIVHQLDQLVAKFECNDDYPFIVEDETFGYQDIGINTDPITSNQIGINYDQSDLSYKMCHDHIYIQVDLIKQDDLIKQYLQRAKAKFQSKYGIIHYKINCQYQHHHNQHNQHNQTSAQKRIEQSRKIMNPNKTSVEKKLYKQSRFSKSSLKMNSYKFSHTSQNKKIKLKPSETKQSIIQHQDEKIEDNKQNNQNIDTKVSKFPYKIIFNERNSVEQHFTIKPLKLTNKKEEFNQKIQKILGETGQNTTSIINSNSKIKSFGKILSEQQIKSNQYIIYQDKIQHKQHKKQQKQQNDLNHTIVIVNTSQIHLSDRESLHQSELKAENSIPSNDKFIKNQQTQIPIVLGQKNSISSKQSIQNYTYIQMALLKYINNIKKKLHKSELINEKDLQKNKEIQISNLMAAKPININNNNDKMQLQNVVRYITEIYKLAYKQVGKKQKLKSIYQFIYQYFTLNCGKLIKTKIQQKIVQFLNLVNHYKNKNQYIQMFALLTSMFEENPYNHLICHIDFRLFLEINFYLNPIQNNRIQIVGVSIQKLNQQFYKILTSYIGENQKNFIKKQLEALLFSRQSHNKNKQIKINLEKLISFLFDLILKARLTYYNDYFQFMQIIKQDKFRVISVEIFQFLGRCVQNKKIEFVKMIQQFILQCDLDIFNKKVMSQQKFTFFCLKYNFFTLQQIYECCINKLESRQLKQINSFFGLEKQEQWFNQIEYMKEQLIRSYKYNQYIAKIFDYLTEKVSKYTKYNQQSIQLIEMIYTMIWNQIFQCQAQKFTSFLIGDQLQQLYCSSFDLIQLKNNQMK